MTRLQTLKMIKNIIEEAIVGDRHDIRHGRTISIDKLEEAIEKRIEQEATREEKEEH